jgi:hypothetical protein
MATLLTIDLSIAFLAYDTNLSHICSVVKHFLIPYGQTAKVPTQAKRKNENKRWIGSIAMLSHPSLNRSGSKFLFNSAVQFDFDYPNPNLLMHPWYVLFIINTVILRKPQRR